MRTEEQEQELEITASGIWLCHRHGDTFRYIHSVGVVLAVEDVEVAADNAGEKGEAQLRKGLERSGGRRGGGRP